MYYYSVEIVVTGKLSHKDVKIPSIDHHKHMLTLIAQTKPSSS